MGVLSSIDGCLCAAQRRGERERAKSEGNGGGVVARGNGYICVSVALNGKGRNEGERWRK